MTAIHDPGTTERAALLTDAARMRVIFQAELPRFSRPGLVIEDCRILHARYRTSAEDRRQGKAFLSVCYALTLRDGVGGNHAEQMQLVKAYVEGRSRQKFAETAAAPTFPPRVGAPVTHVPELDAVIWAFPNDPKLVHLPEVVDPELVRRHLPWDRLDGASNGEDVSIEVVRYKPEVRCITRYQLGGLALYGKTFKHERAGEIAARIEGLSAELAGTREAFVIARPLGCSAPVKTVWQAELRGTPLLRVIDTRNYRDFLERAAVGLARFHGLELPSLPRTTVADRLRAVEEETTELIETYPRLGERLAGLVARLEEAAPRLPPVPEGLVHGDFLLKQLVVHGNRLGLFDFDNLSIGDPIQDLANFLVDLHYHGFDADFVGGMTAVFLGAYRAHAAGVFPAVRLRWHAAVQLLRDGYYFHRRWHLTPGFEAELERLLGMAEHPVIDP